MITQAVIRDFLREVQLALGQLDEGALNDALDILLEAERTGASIYIIGNGGSASTASHFACDLSKGTRVPDRRPMRVFALADNVAVLTAWANDTSYERVFAAQLEALVRPDDVVIAISVSGNSPNILAGLRTARQEGARTIGLLGSDGGVALALVDVAIHVAHDDYGLVEAVHLAVVHGLAKSSALALRAPATSPSRSLVPEFASMI